MSAAQQFTDEVVAWLGANLAGPLAAVTVTVVVLVVLAAAVALATDRWARRWMEAEHVWRSLRVSRVARGRPPGITSQVGW